MIYHQLPASGYLDHGYYCYTPLLFRQLAEANEYVVESLAVTPAGESRIDVLNIPSLGGETMLKEPKPLAENNRIPALNMHVVLRKTTDLPFQVSLEIATSHSEVNAAMQKRYQRLPQQIYELQTKISEMESSLSWRITAPIRRIRTMANHWNGRLKAPKGQA